MAEKSFIKASTNDQVSGSWLTYNIIIIIIMPKYRTVSQAAHSLILMSTKAAKPTFPLVTKWQVNKPYLQAIGSCSIVLRALSYLSPLVTQQVDSNQLHMPSIKKSHNQHLQFFKFIQRNKKLFQSRDKSTNGQGWQTHKFKKHIQRMLTVSSNKHLI